MKSTQLNQGNIATQYAQWLISYRWFVILAAIVLAFAAGSGGRLITPNNDYRVFFSDDNPQLQAFEQVQKTYTKIDNILFAIAPTDGQVFTKDTLAAVEEATEKAWLLPYSLRVDSISNFQHTRAEEDDLIVEDLISGANSLTTEAIAKTKQIALSEPFINGQLLNKDASVTGINVTFQMPQKSR